MKQPSRPLLAAGLAALCAVAAWGGFAVLPRAHAQQAPVKTEPPPPGLTIPPGPFGDMVRLGENIFRDTGTYAPQYTGNDLRCSNCHLQAGRLAGSAPMWAAYLAYPAFRSKNGHVNTYAERLQGCFRYSMNGKPPPLGDKVLVALETYSYFLAKGLPVGESVAGRGFPKLPKAKQNPDYMRGGQVYATNCASCHGPEGQGQSSAGKVVFPPLWGPRSYNWGAGMESVSSAAAFIRANMPLTLGNSLSVQQAWDVAMFIDSQIRPQDPRFDGNVASTRARYHNSPWSMYGRVVNGVLLGDPATAPPSGTVPANTVPNKAKRTSAPDHG